MFDIESPLLLILILAIPLVVLIQLRTNVIATKWRKVTTFLLRCIAIICVILALANLQRAHSEKRLAVVFLLDISDSVAESQREIAIEQINAAIAKLKPTDQFAVIGFATEPFVIISMGEPLVETGKRPTITSILTDPSGQLDSTDIVSALKRSIEHLPDNYHRRIVLFGDGQHNAGNTSISESLPFFSASDVEIMTIPLQSTQDTIQVLNLQLPDNVRKGQRFQIQAIIQSDETIPNVKATLYHNSIPAPDLEFSLKRGRNVIPLPTQQVTDFYYNMGRTHTYHLKLNINDEIIENNEAFGVVQVQDKPHILYADSDLEHADNIQEVLEESGFGVEVIHAADIPSDLVSFQQFDVMILSNISADMVTDTQQEMIESSVRDLGHGLVVIGGDKAFGAGGYTDTVFERILPVDMTPRERKDAVALVFVIDTSGSMANYVGTKSKISLAMDAIRAGIDQLDETDQAAIISFDVNTHVISSLTTDHNRLIKLVGRLKPTGGTAAMSDAIKTAIQMHETADVKRKHIILLSDGKSAGKRSDIIEIARDAAHEKVGITTIGIGDAETELLEEIANTGTGRDIHVQDIQNLPRVLMDAVRETHNYIVQEEFQPKILNSTTQILDGINNLPRLYGYVATAEKPTAQVLVSSHKNEPILAGWRYGLGKSVAWTSDVKPAWGKDWISWTHFSKFWGQVVNWTLPSENTDVDFDLSVSHRNGGGDIRIDTHDLSPVSFVVQVAGPNGTGQTVDITQDAANLFIGSFQMRESGTYIVTAKQGGTENSLSGTSLTVTLSRSYPAEYAVFDVNTALLKKLSQETDGLYQPTIAQITHPGGVPIEERVSLFQSLLIIAAILFVLEMILRRFSIVSGYLAELKAQLSRRTEAIIPEALTQLSQKKTDVDTEIKDGVFTNVEIASVGAISLSHRSSDEVDNTIQQSEVGAMTRLLAAKKRSQSV
ncbi:VWA domain-containing protein [Candidatus Poribacteria bacterium]|nr:VWA domain-containing protein [Candidatus Poribacteria bacterium]